ncbi:MAG TPA: hypothetical protein PL143_06140 [Rhodocyclaceae bacterium]|nr:hypothetical protein [Rhodocyclaceae bacterium]
MPNVDTSRLYTAFPHLAKIDRIWGTRECRQFIRDLLSETRDGQRSGFAPDHASTIMRLLIEHDRHFPDFDDSFGGAWWQKELDRQRQRE